MNGYTIATIIITKIKIQNKCFICRCYVHSVLKSWRLIPLNIIVIFEHIIRYLFCYVLMGSTNFFLLLLKEVFCRKIKVYSHSNYIFVVVTILQCVRQAKIKIHKCFMWEVQINFNEKWRERKKINQRLSFVIYRHCFWKQ